jgi:hypothetical protein
VLARGPRLSPELAGLVGIGLAVELGALTNDGAVRAVLPGWARKFR